MLLNTSSTEHCSMLSKGAVSYGKIRCSALLFMVLNADFVIFFMRSSTGDSNLIFDPWNASSYVHCAARSYLFSATLPSLPLLALNNCFGNSHCAGSTASPRGLGETTTTTTSNSYSGIAGFNGTLIPEPDAHFCLSAFKYPRCKTSSALCSPH